MGCGRYRYRCRGKAVVMTAEIIPEITAAIAALITSPMAAVMTYLMTSTISAVIGVAMKA